jgi:uncharacterized protein
VLVQNRKVDLSMTTLGPAWEAWNGQLDLNSGVKHRDVRALFPMYEGPFHIVSLQKPDKNIKTVRDLDGKVIGIGPASATGAQYFPTWFRQMGLRFATRSGQYMNMAGELIAGRVDAVTFASGLPNPTILDLGSTQAINVFSFNADDLKQILATNPFLSPYTIKQGGYRSMTTPLETLAMWNFAIANRAMPDSLAYEIVRAVLSNNKRLTEIHASAIETVADNVQADRFLWLHPGAIRYYRSIGMTVPDKLVPPEAQPH